MLSTASPPSPLALIFGSVLTLALPLCGILYACTVYVRSVKIMKTFEGYKLIAVKERFVLAVNSIVALGLRAKNRQAGAGATAGKTADCRLLDSPGISGSALIRLFAAAEGTPLLRITADELQLMGCARRAQAAQQLFRHI